MFIGLSANLNTMLAASYYQPADCLAIHEKLVAHLNSLSLDRCLHRENKNHRPTF